MNDRTFSDREPTSAPFFDGGDEAVSAAGSFYESEKNVFSISRVISDSPSSMRSHHYHDSYELYYLCSGDRYYFIKDKTYHISKGDLVLINPYDVHSTGNYGRSGYDRFLITFRSSFLSDFSEALGGMRLFRCFEKDIRVFSLDAEKQSRVEALLFAMLKEYESRETGYEHVLRAAMVQLLLIICRCTGSGEGAVQRTVSGPYRHVSAAVVYICSHYSEPISLADISKKLFLSQSHFSRIFKRTTGVSFTQYVNGIRIKEAQRLLRCEHMSITAVSEAVGYNNTTHFGRIFKSITGISPNEYRKNN